MLLNLFPSKYWRDEKTGKKIQNLHRNSKNSIILRGLLEPWYYVDTKNLSYIDRKKMDSETLEISLFPTVFSEIWSKNSDEVWNYFEKIDENKIIESRNDFLLIDTGREEPTYQPHVSIPKPITDSNGKHFEPVLIKMRGDEVIQLGIERILSSYIFKGIELDSIQITDNNKLYTKVIAEINQYNQNRDYERMEDLVFGIVA